MRNLDINPNKSIPIQVTSRYSYLIIKSLYPSSQPIEKQSFVFYSCFLLSHKKMLFVVTAFFLLDNLLILLFGDNEYDYHPIERKTYLTSKKFHLFQNSFQLEVLSIAPLFLISWESIKILKLNQKLLLNPLFPTLKKGIIQLFIVSSPKVPEF